jgi:hypothetical protein
MRTISYALLAMLALVCQARSEEPATLLPPIIVGGEPDKTGQRHVRRCIEVEIGEARSYECLNAELAHRAENAGAASLPPPVTAASPDIRTGVANVPALRQQYGPNFGTSVVPYRPPVATYTTPLGR